MKTLYLGITLMITAAIIIAGALIGGGLISGGVNVNGYFQDIFSYSHASIFVFIGIVIYIAGFVTTIVSIFKKDKTL